MDRFDYQAIDKDGEKSQGEIEAINKNQAMSVLRSKGLFIVSLKKIEVMPSWIMWLQSLRKIKFTDVVHFTRQLATMINAGLPLTDALNILKFQSNAALSKIVGEVLLDVEGGGSFYKALAKHPDIFSPVYLSLVRSGEAAGVLEKILLRLSENMEKEAEFKSKIKNAMIYPIIVVLAMMGVALIMMIFVIPKLTDLYDDFGADLPMMTKILLKLSNFIVNRWYVLLVLAVGTVYGLWAFKRSKKGRYLWDKYILKLPIFGKLKTKTILTEITRTLGLLAQAGIPIVEALEIVSGTADNVIFSDSIKTAAKEVEKGVPIAAAIGKYEHFPPIVPQMIATGEETGKIDEVLGNISRFFESEAEQAVKGLTTAIEPLMMIVLGIGVAFLVMAIVLPIYNLTSQF